MSIDEFRVFNAYVVIYAIFDASRRSTAGARGETPACKRIELHEWLAGYEVWRGSTASAPRTSRARGAARRASFGG